MIDVSLRALRRMRRLVDDFFTLERLLENGYDLKREQVSLADIVQGAVQHCRKRTASPPRDGRWSLRGHRRL